MKKLFIYLNLKAWAFMLISLLFSAYVKATVWRIPNTATDTLEHFFELHYGTIWQPGDTIMLSRAGEYIINGTIDIYQEVTITGDPNLPLSPILRLMDNGFRPKEDTINVTIKNLRFDGYNYNESDPKYAGFVLRFKIGTTYWKNIIIEDIEAWNMQGILDLDENKHTIYDTVILNNIVAHDFNGTQFLLDPNINYAKYLSITNSTFYNIPGGILANPDWNGNGTLDVDKNWIIDHNTFYNVVGDGNRALVQINDPDDGTVDFTFTNNIVSKLYNKSDARPFRINAQAGDFTFAYSTIHDFYSTYQGSVHNLDTVAKLSNVTTSNIYGDYPGFADTANYIFTINAGSPLLTAGSDGGPIGDPRWVSYEEPWAPGPNSHLIPNTSPDTLEHFLEVHYGTLWQPGDTIVLISNGEYVVNGTMDIYQEVTITGAPNLPVSPILCLMDNGFRPKEDTINVTIKNLRFDGYNYNESDPKYAGFVLRFKIGTTYWKNIIIENIEAWNMQGILDLDENKHTIYDTVILNNIVAHDFNGTQFLLDPNINYAKYLAITNSTFYNIPGGILANPDWNGNGTLDVDKNWIIDHNTFYNVVGDGNRALVQINDPDDGTVDFTFTNNIVSRLYNKSDARPFRINGQAGDFTFAYSTIHDFYSTYQGSVHNLDSLVKNLANIDTINIYRDDPGFADTDYYNFSISEGNPLLTAGSDGGPIGDPRWLPYTAKKVVSIGAVLKKVIPNYDVQLSVTVDLPPGINKSVTWDVEDGYNGTSGAATIDANGLLSPIAVGDVKVTATSNYDNELFDTLIVTIEEQIFISSIVLSAEDSQGNPTTEITNPGGFLTVTAVIEPGDADDKSLSWDITDDNIVNLIEKTPTTAEVVAKVSGTVDVTATANDGSETFGSLTITVSLPSAVENTTYSKVQLLPNPASDFIRISSDQVVDVVITNITGAVVMSDHVQPNGTMNISELKAGIYIVTIATGDISKTIQLIVE